jgi:hypothetical protein
VANFPTIDGRRLNLRISSSGDSVTLALTRQATSGLVRFELPSFVENIASSTAGTIDQATGTVTLVPGTTKVTVRLRKSP